MPAGWTAAAIAGAGAASAGSQMIGGGKASSAAKDAAKLQQQQYETTRGDLQPYNLAGQSVLGPLATVATSGPFGGGPDYVTQAAGLAPGAMTEAELTQTPGYQFTLAQGLKATQANAAARGLGVSGSALKGAASFVTGLADKTYQDQFDLATKRMQNALALNTAQQGNLTNQFNRLSALATLGQNAAAKTGEIGQNLTGAGATATAGQEQAQGTIGAANALNQSLQSYLGYNQFQQLMQNQNQNRGGTSNVDAGTWTTPVAASPMATTGYNYGTNYGYNPVAQGGY